MGGDRESGSGEDGKVVEAYSGVPGAEDDTDRRSPQAVGAEAEPKHKFR